MNQQSMRKPPIAWLILGIIAAGILTVIHLLAGWNTLAVSLKDYQPAAGLLNSASIGLRNYEMLFSQPSFTHVLANTLIQTILIGACTAALSAGAVFGLLRLPARARILVSAGLFLPYLVTQGTGVVGIINLLGSAALMIQGGSLLAYILYRTALLTPFVVLVGTLLSLLTRTGTAKLLVITLITALGASWYVGFSGGIMPAHALTNPATYAWMDNLNFYSYRVGFIQGQYSLSAVTDTLAGFFGKLGLALFGAAGAVILLIRSNAPAPQPKDKAGLLAGLPAALLALAALVIGVLGIKRGAPGLVMSVSGIENGVPVGMGNIAATLLTVISPLLGAALGIAMAAILIRLPRAGGFIWVAFAVLLATSTSVSIGSYLSTRSQGMINTLFPSIDTSWPVLLPMLATALAWPRLANHSLGRILMAACGVALLAWLPILADPAQGLILTPQRELMPLSTLAYISGMQGGAAGIGPIECLFQALALAGGTALLAGAVRPGAEVLEDA